MTSSNVQNFLVPQKGRNLTEKSASDIKTFYYLNKEGT